jgi:hypothetical protein
VLSRGKYGALRRRDTALVWLLDTAFCLARAVLVGLKAAAAVVLVVALAIGTQLRQRIAGTDLVMDPASGDEFDPTGPPIRATAVRLDDTKEDCAV